jgi:hypothetical protein
MYLIRSQDTVSSRVMIGIFLVTLSTLMYEILLTRIFSVTMWYHFAFVAISVAMFGMTVGAVLVYLRPSLFTPERARRHLSVSALLFAMSIVLTFYVHLSVPFIIQWSLRGLGSIAFTYVVITIPFIFSGICVCLALTKFPQHVSRLYAADLAGGSLGCILLIYTLNIIDGPTAVVFVAFLAGGGALLFAVDARSESLKRWAVVCTVLLAVLTLLNAVLTAQHRPLLRLAWVKGELEPPPLYEKWNSFSRISVPAEHDESTLMSGWGISSTYVPARKVRQLFLKIDSTAYTPLTSFRDMEDLEHLRYDVTNLVHYIKQDSDVLVIGAGGGRDILSALLFGQRSVVAVEINRNIIRAVNERFGDFTRHLDQNPRVTFVNDEARSYVARRHDTYGVIQVSLIDTWAATAAGAFVLSESALYTVEAWKTFLERLDPDGILTFSRWYFRDSPGEVYRLTALATAALSELGADNPRDHIVIVRNMQPEGATGPDGVGTILVKRQPFSDREIRIVENISERMRFDMVLSPRAALNATFANLTSPDDLASFTASFPLNIAPPTDDSPFFFHMLRLKDIFKRELWEQGYMTHNMKAVFVLGALLIVVIGLTCLCIIVPLLATADRASLKGATPLIAFFSGIGLGFMFIEISQMQRLIVFLGHPTYGLSVVLFSLLVASGAGSYTTDIFGRSKLFPPNVACLC